MRAIREIVYALRDARDMIRYGQDLSYEQFMVDQNRPENFCGSDVDENGYPTKAGIKRGEEFIARARNWTPLGWKLYGLRCAALTVWDNLVCAVKDHDWESDDWGGPESGGMAAHCKRCGFGFRHTMY